MNPLARITQDGAIFFDVELYDTIPTEVRLTAEYKPLNGRPVESRLVPMGFVNTNTIMYLEREPPLAVMGTEFTVRVALITPDLDTRGPFSDESQILGEYKRVSYPSSVVGIQAINNLIV